MTRPDLGRSRRTVAVAVVIVGLGLAASACGTAEHVASASDTSSKSSTTATAPAGPSGAGPSAPKSGRCRLLTAKDIPPSDNLTHPRSCHQRHTAVTYFVGTFRPAMLGRSKAVVSTFADRRCDHELTRYLGGDLGDRAQTLLTYAYFYPNAKQRAAKENWFRCDAVSGYELQNRLYPLPASMRGILSDGVPDSVRACYTKRFINNGDSKDPGAWVPCRRSHAQRTIASLRLGGPATTYSGFDRLGTKVSAWCKPKARAFLGNPTTYSWGYNWPDAKEWRRGDRYGRCLAVTTR